MKRNKTKTKNLPYFLPIAGLLVIEPIVATKTMIENKITNFEAISLSFLIYIFWKQNANKIKIRPLNHSYDYTIKLLPIEEATKKKPKQKIFNSI